MLIDIYRQLRATNSRNDKIAILQKYKNDPDLRLYLEWTFSPYITWGVKFDNSINSLSIGVQTDWSEQDKNILAELRSNPSNRLLNYSRWLKFFTREVQEMFIGMLNKNPRLGITGATVLQVMPDLWEAIKVPLAYPVRWDKVKYPCIAQVKIDGLRCIYKNGQFLSRKGLPLHGLDSILKSLEAIGLDGTDLDGEIWAPGESFDAISGKIRSFDKVKDAHYYIFDMDKNNSYDFRHAVLNLMAKDWQAKGITNLSVPLTKEVATQDELYDVYEEATNYGFEGIMIKDKEALPFNGRKYTWMKMKPSDTIDLTVTGIEEGEGKYTGMVGALVCEYEGQTVHIGSGLLDIQRTKWMKQPSMIIGKTIEVEFMEKSSKGKLRHPRLLHVRGDK